MALDVARSLTDLWFRLGFLDQTDLDNADWISEADLYQFCDDAVKRLSYISGIFKSFNSAVPAPTGSGAMALPVDHVFTVFAYVSYSPSFVQLLRLTNVEQLYALDVAWGIQRGVPSRLSFDAQTFGSGGTRFATLYPMANQDGTLCQVMQYTPASPVAGASVLPMTPAAQDYFTYAVLQECLSEESDHAKPEVAAHAAERMRLYEKVFEQYYGPGA